MITKEITFTDLDDNVVTETWLFHLSMDELTDMAANNMDYGDQLLKIGKEKTPIDMIRAMRELIKHAVGKREGRRIVKSQEITDDFFGCGAWQELYVELLTDDALGAEFFNGMVPMEYLKKVTSKLNAEPQSYTDEQLLEMSDEQFAAYAGDDPKNMTPHHLQIAFRRKERALAAAKSAA